MKRPSKKEIKAQLDALRAESSEQNPKKVADSGKQIKSTGAAPKQIRKQGEK